MRSHLVVGLLVSLALAIVLSFGAWLTGRQGSEPLVNYSLYFENDVSGLMLGGPVYYLGVEVGTVTRMEIIPGNPMRVRVDVQVLETTPVDTGTSGSLQFQGITGVAVINLVGEPGMNLPLKKPPGEDYQVIEVRDMGLVALLSDAPALIEKVNALLDQASTLVGQDNQASIATTLENIQSLSGTLREQETMFADLPRSLNETMGEIRSLLDEFQTGAQNMRPGFEAAIANVERMSRDLGELTSQLNEWAGDNSEDMSRFLDHGLGQVPALVTDARDAIRELEKLLRDLRDNPSSLIYQPARGAEPE